MNNKKIVSLVVMFTFILATMVVAQNDEPQPTIVINGANHKMGEVFESKAYIHVFKVRNTGNADLVIENVKPG